MNNKRYASPFECPKIGALKSILCNQCRGLNDFYAVLVKLSIKHVFTDYAGPEIPVESAVARRT